MRFRRLFLGLTATLLATSAMASSEQWLTRYAPPTSPESQVGHISETDSAVKRSDADRAKLVIKSLKAVVFVTQPSAVKKRGARAQGVVDGQGVLPEEAKAAAETYLGQAITFGALDQFTRDLVLAFRHADRPLVNVVVPEQEVSNGVLQILVVVGRLGEVSVSGVPDTDKSHYKDEVHLTPGAPISEGTLLDDLRYFNRNPFRNVAAVYQPGRGYGLTDVELQVAQPKNWQVYGGTETKGNGGALGRYRPFVGATATNLLGLDEVYGYQFTWANTLNALRSHVFSFNLPLPGRFQLEALYGRTDTHVADQSPLSQNGASDVVGLYVLTALPHWGALSHDLRTGVEYKRSNTNVDFGGTTAVTGVATIAQAVVGYTGELVSWVGVTKFDGNLYVSPGSVLPNNNDTAFASQRATAKSSYAYGRLTIDNRADLPGAWRIATTVTGQDASQSLLPSEELELGGIGSVRGFVYDKSRADTGYIGNLTLYTPPLGLFTTLVGETSVLDRLRLYTFIDTGAGWNVSPTSTESKTTGLTGSGLGLSYEFGSTASVDFGYGWKLSQYGAGSSSNGAFHLRAVARF